MLEGMEKQRSKALNKDCNNYYIKVAILFAFLSELMGWAVHHCAIYSISIEFVHYKEISFLYVLIFFIQFVLYVIFYGLGRLFNFNISLLIIFISFCEFVFVFGGVWVVSLFGSNDPLFLFRHICFDLYFIILFSSKFLLISIFKRKKKQLREQYRKFD